MKNIGCVYITFEQIKKQYGLPEDALLKIIEPNNAFGQVDFFFYTNADLSNAEPLEGNSCSIRRRELK